VARLFVTYRHTDLALAREFVSELRGGGHHVTLDQDYLVLGEEWRRALHEAFVAADGLVVILTPNSVDPETRHISSQYIAADIGSARAAGKVVMPIIAHGTPLPNLVSDIHAEWMTAEVAPFEAEGQPELRAFHVRVATVEIQRMVTAIKRGLERRAEHKKQVADTLVLPGYEHLVNGVRHFHQDTPYDKSVFVMMKFPDPQLSDVHRQLLNDIWRVVSDTVAQRGLKARRADLGTYYDQLWENVCVHMFGSKYGMAILEDHVAAELNPNVTLEYGFMKALNRSVGLFRAADFRHDRADLTGKLAKTFSIDANHKLDETSLKSAIQDWLMGMPL
jgi:TIR domain